jgi:hypothetical protein
VTPSWRRRPLSASRTAGSPSIKTKRLQPWRITVRSMLPRAVNWQGKAVASRAAGSATSAVGPGGSGATDRAIAGIDVVVHGEPVANSRAEGTGS